MERSKISFLEFLKAHDELDDLFLQHQEAVLASDIPGAGRLLSRYKEHLEMHIRQEEEVLLPLYDRPDHPPARQARVFTLEHRKILEKLERLRQWLDELKKKPLVTPRQIIILLDVESSFKRLVEHHNEREKNVLYPALDDLTSEKERLRVLRACGEEWTRRTRP